MSVASSDLAIAQRGLDPLQLGHIKRTEQLARRLPNDWSGMHGLGAGQGDDMGGYRFQIAYAAYALALAHRHRLPNAPAMFKDTFQRLIEKLREPAVWLYWRDVSQGGSAFNAHLMDGYTEQWDPVVKDNIMYSAYLQSLPAMYNVLFDDNRYTKPGALSLSYGSFLWGGDTKTFDYDQNSLTDLIYWQMVESGYLGIACEPNCVFQICNQPPIIGFRMQDILNDTQIADEVVAGYAQAFEDFGRLDEDGHYYMLMFEDSKIQVPNHFKQAWLDAWAGTLMNTWNRDFVRKNYPRQIADYVVEGPDGTLSTTFVPANNGFEVFDTDFGNFGWLAAWASEMGDTSTLEGVLAHADRFMRPTWENGALYYPRNDRNFDDDGTLLAMAPLTGNALLGYARLNVQDGMWSLYNEPWDRSHFAEPLIVERSDDVDITKAIFDRAVRTLDFSVQPNERKSAESFVEIDNVAEFSLRIDGQPVADTSAMVGRHQSRLRIDVPTRSATMTLTVPHWQQPAS